MNDWIILPLIMGHAAAAGATFGYMLARCKAYGEQLDEATPLLGFACLIGWPFLLPMMIAYDLLVPRPPETAKGTTKNEPNSSQNVCTDVRIRKE